nr:laccase-1 [Quercus suber]
MNTHAEEDEQGHSSRQSSEAGQEEGLLGNHETTKETEDVDEFAKTYRRSAPRWKTTRSRVEIAAAVTLGLVLGIFALLAFRVVHDLMPEVDVNTLDVETSDYILDPRWDFDASPTRREFHWTIRDREFNPDGVFRSMMLVNNQFPGPMLEVNEGDTIVLHVDNQAMNATAIHFHGLYQRGTPYMDGTVGLAQCPIAPGANFTYEFTIANQSGTYWWHAHQGVQASDGLHGPMVIHSRRERELQKLPYVTDRVIMVSDYYLELSSALLWQYLKPDMENAEPIPVGALLNGRGNRDCNHHPDKKCDPQAANKRSLFSMKLEPGFGHRLRIINTGAMAEFQVQLDEHELAVTEVDGTDVYPVNFHRLNINPAQRYSVIINTTVQTTNTFNFRARMISKCFAEEPSTLTKDINALVYYDQHGIQLEYGAGSQDWEDALAQECRDLNTTELIPVEAIAAPAKADTFFYLRSSFEIGAHRLSRGMFNSSSFRVDVHSPSLLRSMDGLKENNVSFASTSVSSPGDGMAFVNDAAFDISRELVIQTTGSQTIDILFSNFDDGNHPLHLHGYKYFVLGQGHGYPAQIDVANGINPENLAPMYNSLDLTNPLRRDTASVEAFGWLLIRVVADNPGIWPLHCHLSWHTEAGLLMQLLTNTDELAKMEIPEAHRALCAAQGLEKGAAPKDEDYVGLDK